MDASAEALLHCVAVARDASASSVARASVRRPRLARSSDGGNDAALDDYRNRAKEMAYQPERSDDKLADAEIG
jgi:hypothetical protein